MQFVCDLRSPEKLVSEAQLQQDLLALIVNDFKKNGYFVEFGATNGVDLSNSHLLEKTFGWTGILAEPAKTWHAALFENRSCHIETDCVWETTGETLDFDIVEVGEFSTLSAFSDKDLHSSLRQRAEKDQVKTISLLDLLEKYDAPSEIDYLSVDTEGSEYPILAAFDFDRYRFNFISVEHNYTEQRRLIHDLLSAKGYRRILENCSAFDDWYIPLNKGFFA